MKKILVTIIIVFSFAKGQYAAAQNTLQPSVVVWGFRCPFEFLCETAKQNGISTLELLSPEKWKRAKQNGMQVLVANGADLGVERGFCNPDFHQQLQERYLRLIPQAAENGIKMIICYSGISPDISSEQAMKNCVEGLKPVVQFAEKQGITMVMELISSKPSKASWWQHTFPYYACNNIAWGKALADEIASPNFKLLYNVWQMNNMGANVVEDIQNYHQYIAHYHISGEKRKSKIILQNNSIDCSLIIKTIQATRYTGFVGLEFLIEKNIPGSIRSAVSLINK